MSNYKYEISHIKAKARGRWLELITALDSRFENAAKHAGKHVACPMHGGNDGFRFFRDSNQSGNAICNTCGRFDDGIALLQYANDWDFVTTLRHISQYLGGMETEPQPRKNHNIPRENKAGHRENGVKKQWREAQKEPTAEALLYFKNRGIANPIQSKSIRYHSGIPFFVEGRALTDNKGQWIMWPAIIGAMRDSKGLSALYQIYITNDGQKATSSIHEAMKRQGLDAHIKSADCKRFYNFRDMKGSAIRFDCANDLMAVGEGLETMLAVASAGKFTSMAACGTGALLSNIQIPKTVKRLIIFIDKDRNHAGQNSAIALFEKMEEERPEIEVTFAIPDINIPKENKGIDWLDWLNTHPRHARKAISALLCVNSPNN